MERGESILDAIFDEDNFEDVQDVEMMDIEEGELVGHDSETELGQNVWRRCSCSKSRIWQFVLDICRRLKEKKTYLVYTAVGRLGVSALSDLVKEVDAIQACGGQKTADGRRLRFGGGVLWSVLKTRDPNAYEEIMRKGKEFEKQFRQQNMRRHPMQNKEASPERTGPTSTNQTAVIASDCSPQAPDVQNQVEQPNVEARRISVHDRIRVPVTYDDLLGEEVPKDESRVLMELGWKENLDMASITLNKNSIPGPQGHSSVGKTPGRLLPRGFTEKEFIATAEFIQEGVQITLDAKRSVSGSKLQDFMKFVGSPDFSLMDRVSDLRRRVEAVTTQFPLPGL
ncbi:hypothetical protein Acr_26g0004760 [Actinidia rufa]|uniref:Phosphorylated adapter RNA export protein n=1 Tax=Actinidia rufa TaxID=165716 RepID=A0A7J0H296_9ERIC|nr:hypothetical protein Acr_26g0004760 [Actinidia rufa]